MSSAACVCVLNPEAVTQIRVTWSQPVMQATCPSELPLGPLSCQPQRLVCTALAASQRLAAARMML